MTRCNARASEAPTPTDNDLFSAYWKDQPRINIYEHSPAQIAEGLRNVYFLGLTAATKTVAQRCVEICDNHWTRFGDAAATAIKQEFDLG